MTIKRPRLQLGMELPAEKPGMPLQFHYFDQAVVGRDAGRDEADFFERLAIGVVNFPSMAMPLRNARLAIQRRRQRARLQYGRIGTEAHRAALVRDVLLRVHYMDDGIGTVGRVLRSVRALEPEQVARRLDHHHVQPVADSENRHAILARIADRANHALRAALAEAAGDYYRVSLRQPLLDVLLF